MFSAWCTQTHMRACTHTQTHIHTHTRTHTCTQKYKINGIPFSFIFESKNLQKMIITINAESYVCNAHSRKEKVKPIKLPQAYLLITILLRYSLKQNTINFKANHMRATFVFLWGWSDNTRSNMQFSCLKSQITQRFCKGSPEENCAALINSVSL